MTESLVIEELDFPWEVFIDADPEVLFDPASDDVDTMAHRVALVGELATNWIRGTARIEAEGGTDPMTYFTGVSEAFHDAAETYERLVDREDFEDVLEEGLGVLDRPTLAEVRGTIGYLAPYLGVEIEFPEVDSEQ